MPDNVGLNRQQNRQQRASGHCCCHERHRKSPQLKSCKALSSLLPFCGCQLHLADDFAVFNEGEEVTENNGRTATSKLPPVVKPDQH